MDTNTTKSDRLINAYLDRAFDDKGVTQADVQKILNRSQGYVSERRSCTRSWAVSELDRIAPLIGLPDALTLMAAAIGSSNALH